MYTKTISVLFILLVHKYFEAMSIEKKLYVLLFIKSLRVESIVEILSKLINGQLVFHDIIFYFIFPPS